MREILDKIKGLDVAEGLKNCGSEELYLRTIENFYKLIDIKSVKLEQCLVAGEVYDYTVEVHALKNTARMIGALELSELFYQMECLGKDEDLKEIERRTPELLQLYRSYKEALADIRSGAPERVETDAQTIKDVLMRLHDAMDSFELDDADAAMAELDSYILPKDLQPLAKKLDIAVADVAIEDALKLTQKICAQLEKLHLNS